MQPSVAPETWARVCFFFTCTSLPRRFGLVADTAVVGVSCEISDLRLYQVERGT